MKSRMRLRRIILGIAGVALMAVMSAGRIPPSKTRQSKISRLRLHPLRAQKREQSALGSLRRRAKPATPPTGSGFARVGELTDSSALLRRSLRPPSPRPRPRQAPRAPGLIWELLPTAISPTTIHRRVNEVPVVFTVTDRRGHYVKDLQREDFQVLDNNQPPAEIRSFHRETNLPLEVGLLVDASNSVRDRFRFEQDSAIEFLNQTVRPRYDKAFVVGFDVTPEVTQDFTDNTELLSRGVRSLRPGGGTAMFDALYFACRDKLLKTQPGRPGAARDHSAQRRRR